jgi:predicted phage-related endonuclease
VPVPRKPAPRKAAAVIIPAETPLDAVADAVAGLRRVKARQKKAAAEAQKYEKIIKDAMGDSPVGTVAGQPAVRWATTARMGVDVKAVKEKFPDVASACSRVTTVRTFQLVDPA